MSIPKTFERHGHTWTVEYSEPMDRTKIAGDTHVVIASVQARGKKQLAAFGYNGKDGGTFYPTNWYNGFIVDSVAFRKKRDSILKESVNSFEAFLNERISSSN